jgi:glutathione peroxidase-family protein
MFLDQPILPECFRCSDFQADNPDCPVQIRQALKLRYNEKFKRAAKLKK